MLAQRLTHWLARAAPMSARLSGIFGVLLNRSLAGGGLDRRDSGRARRLAKTTTNLRLPPLNSGVVAGTYRRPH